LKATNCARIDKENRKEMREMDKANIHKAIEETLAMEVTDHSGKTFTSPSQTIKEYFHPRLIHLDTTKLTMRVVYKISPRKKWRKQ